MKRQPIPIKIEKDNENHKFESLSACARFLKCQPGQLTMSHSYKGWNITLLGLRTKMSELKRKVYQFHMTGEFIQEFESVHSCSRYFGIPAKHLVNKIKSGKYKEFILSYSKENSNTVDLNEYN